MRRLVTCSAAALFAAATLTTMPAAAAPSAPTAVPSERPTATCIKATTQLNKALQAKRGKKVIKRLQARRAARCTVAPPTPTPTPTPTPITTPIEKHQPNTLEDRVFTLLNKERNSFGLPLLQRCGRLDAAARDYAVLMASTGHYDHIGPDGRSPSQRIEAGGYNWQRVAENIAAGYTAAEDVMQAWMQSTGHRENILNGALVHIGIGYAPATGQPFNTYWVQKFGTGGTCSP